MGVGGKDVMIDSSRPPHENLSHESLNSFAPGRWYCHFELVIFNLISRIDILNITGEIDLMWMPQDFTVD